MSLSLERNLFVIDYTHSHVESAADVCKIGTSVIHIRCSFCVYLLKIWAFIMYSAMGLVFV